MAWTMHFGVPVVPLEYTTRKGSEKSVSSNTNSSDRALEMNSSQVLAPGTLATSAGFPHKSTLRNDALELIHALHSVHDAPHLLSQINRLAVVDRPIVHKQPPGPYLRQPVQDALDAHVRARAGKQRAQRRRGKKHHKRVETRTRHERDAISLPDTPFSHGIAQPSDPLPQLSPRNLPDRLEKGTLADLRHGDLLVCLGAVDDPLARLDIPREENVLRKVHPHAAEPAGNTVHTRILIHDHGGDGAAVYNGEVREHVTPEHGAACDGEGVQRVVGGESLVDGSFERELEFPHVGRLFGGVLPEFARDGVGRCHCGWEMWASALDSDA